MSGTDLLQLCLVLGLTPIPLKSRSKEPMVRWGNGWNPTPEELAAWATGLTSIGAFAAALNRQLWTSMRQMPSISSSKRIARRLAGLGALEELGEVIELIKIRKNPPPKPATKGEQS